MVHKLCRSERIGKFTQLEGWYSNIGTYEYAVPESSTEQNIELFHVLKLKYIDPSGNFALYKCLQFQSQAVYDILTAAGDTSSSQLTSIQGVVASYDRDYGQIKLEIVDMDDKTIYRCIGKGKTFRGTIVEFGVNTAATNDVALRGGFVGGFTLKKLDVAPVGYESLNFDAAYTTQYQFEYPVGDN